MDRNIFQKLTDWAAAYQQASENATIILQDASDATMAMCAERMQVLQRCEQALLDLDIKSNLPRPLETFINAKNDSACVSCVYGGVEPIHPSCQYKMNFMFRSTQILYEYVVGLV